MAMIEALVITLFPVLFLVILFGGGELFRRRKISQDGDAPVNKTIFYLSKYSILILWGATVLASWGIGISLLEVPELIQWIALFFWITGFMLLFLGRLGLGSSFRLGTPREGTSLRVTGLYSVSRNPMYLGVYATILASVLYTLNPLVLVLGIFVVAVHHRIVLGEEEHMQKVFGEEYTEYRHRVRRYL